MKRLLLVLMAAGLLTAFANAQPLKTRTIHVSVTDEEGAPVTGLSVADLSITENGVTRPVVSVTDATAPMNVGLVFDDRALWAPPVRASLGEFARSLSGKAFVGLFSYSRPEWTVLDFTRDTNTVEHAIDAMAAVPTGMNDPEGLLQTLGRRFRKQESVHPVLVVLTFGSPTCAPRNCPSSLSPRWDLVLEDLLRSGTTVYAVGTNPIEPAHLIYAAAETTGGTAERILTDTAVSQAMRRTADSVLSQQTVTYTSTEAPREGFRLRVAATRAGLRVRAPEKTY
jgi:hypothetical protein